MDLRGGRSFFGDLGFTASLVGWLLGGLAVGVSVGSCGVALAESEAGVGRASGLGLTIRFEFGVTTGFVRLAVSVLALSLMINFVWEKYAVLPSLLACWSSGSFSFLLFSEVWHRSSFTKILVPFSLWAFLRYNSRSL